MKKNIVQLRNGFVSFSSNGNTNTTQAYSVNAELMRFGYMLDPTALAAMESASLQDISAFYNETIDYLKKALGADKNFQPFWKNFPNDVMSMSEQELWAHQLLHYRSHGSYDPVAMPEDRGVAFEQSKYTILTAGNEQRFEKIFTDLVSVNNSLTPDDMQIVEWFVSTKQNLVFPDQIPFKENLCTLASFKLDVPVKTVTDVLRIAVSMSGGDISLPTVAPKMIRANAWSRSMVENTARNLFKFKKFKRAERIYLLGLLEKTNCSAKEMQLKKDRWTRLGEILHPGEFSKRFPKSAAAFLAIRNQKDTKVRTWYSEVDRAFDKSFEAGLTKLAERPGELFRRIDSLVRTYQYNTINLNAILTTIESVADKCSNKVLFEVYEHFEKRNRPVQNRGIMIKGARKRTTLPDLVGIDQTVIDQIQRSILSAVRGKFAKLPSMGNVFVDEDLKKIPMPTNMRSMSSSTRPRIRGQRIPIGNQTAKVARCYVHWFDQHGNEDLDLTATFIGMGKTEQVGWNGNKNTKYGTYSGDVRHRQGACAEYVDINFDEAVKAGFKYAVIDVRNYMGRGFNTLSQCVFGFMEREFAQADHYFKPDTIVDAMQLESTSTTCIAVIVDVETREFIFLDIDQDGIPVASANVNQILDAVKVYTEAPKVSVYDLIMMHVNSRSGVQVDSKENADVLFNMSDFEASYVEVLKLMQD